MTATLVNLTGNVGDLIGADFDPRRVKVWVTTNLPDDVLIDAAGNEVRLGDAYATVNSDGTFTFTDLWATNGATNPTAFQYQLHIDYTKRSEPKGRKVWDSGWFDLTATSDLADVAQGQYVPPTWMTTATQTLQTYVTDAQTAEAAAQTARTEAEAARDAAVDISNIDVPDAVVEALVLNTGGAGPLTSAALDATIDARTDRLYVVTPGVAGVMGDGVTNDTTAIQSVLDACPQRGTVYIAPGLYIADGLVIDKQIAIRGAGMAGLLGTFGSGIRTASTTASVFTITANGVTFSDLAIQNTAGTAPTAGAGIVTTTARHLQLTRVSITGFYDLADIEGQQYVDIDGCYFADPVRYGVRLRNTAAADSGDSVIRGCAFLSAVDTSRTGAAAIRLESGGGLKIVGTKINYNGGTSWLRGVDVDIAGSTGTSVLVISGSSIEACTDRNVSVRAASTAGFGYVSVTGCQLSGTGDAIVVGDATSAYIEGVAVTGNVFIGFVRSVYTYKARTVAIGPNAHQDCATLVDVGPNCQHVDIATQTAKHGTASIVVQKRYPNEAGQGNRVCEDSCAVPSGATTSTYVDLYTITVPDYSVAKVELEIAGLLNSVGATALRRRRSLLMGSGSAVTVATLGADEVTGQGLDILFDTTTVGQVTVRARLASGSTSTGLAGAVARVKVTDHYESVTRIPAA